MSGGILPFLFGRQAVNGFSVSGGKPCAICDGIVIGDIHHGMPFAAGGMTPFLHSFGGFLPVAFTNSE